MISYKMNPLQFKQWFESKDDKVKEVADKWFRPDGSAKFRAMTETMIADTMKTYGLSLEDAAKLFERAILYYKNEHVCGGAEAYWALVNDLKQEMDGIGTFVAGINSCKPTADYQVWGACTDLGDKHGKKHGRKKGKRS